MPTQELNQKALESLQHIAIISRTQTIVSSGDHVIELGQGHNSARISQTATTRISTIQCRKEKYVARFSTVDATPSVGSLKMRCMPLTAFYR